MKTLLAAIAAAIALTACGGGPNAAACKTVLEQRYAHAITHPDAPADDSLPDACKGLDAKTMNRIVGEILYGK
jgi:uncharacterized lipoprotein